MRFKLDENLSPGLVTLFTDAGHEADTVLAESIQGAADEIIFAKCQEENRCLITLDLDFANPLRFPPSRLPGLIVLRPARPVLPLIQAILLSLLPTLKMRFVSFVVPPRHRPRKTRTTRKKIVSPLRLWSAKGR